MFNISKSWTAQEYLSENCRTVNAQMVRDLLLRVTNNFSDDIPPPYKELISNLCKNSSISGLLQCTSDFPLELLKQFCERRLNLRTQEQKENVVTMKRELPVIWMIIRDIFEIESQTWLPRDVEQILLKIVHIRRYIFMNSAERFSSDYSNFPVGEENPLMFYPNWPIFRYPKKYQVGNSVEEDLCEKRFRGHKDFSCGFLSVGCFCSRNITHGFEMLLNRESSHNIFRLIQCRDLDRANLKGIIYDNACNLNSYILNREPRENEFLQCLVDGCHWNNHKGCSQGFNSKNYKEFIPTLNSQGREQMHSVLEKLSPAFRNMNYFSYMTKLRVFFGVNNLKKKGII